MRGVDPIEDFRTDLYLADARQTDIGIKQRGRGATEVKVLIELPEVSLAEHMDGQPEIWVKAEGVELPLTDENTIAVGKQRRRRVLGFESGSWVEALSEDEVEEGVVLEASEVEASGGKWQTACFEAFGPDDRIVPLLQAAITLIGPWPDSIGGPRVSGGYPLWLSELAREGAGAEAE